MSDSDSPRHAAPGTAVAADRRMMHLAYETESPPAELVRQHLADQLEPVLLLRDELARLRRPGIDLAHARERLAAGLTAYDPLEAIGSAGNLSVPFVRATVAVEKSGLALAREASEAREYVDDLMPLITGWLGCEPTPRDRVRAAARRAAAVIANAVLRATSQALLEGIGVPRTQRATCPCCGSAPEFSREDDTHRLLACARCDAVWETSLRGCLGCEATLPPAIAHVEAPLLGYRLVMCSPCGRYLKEPLGPTASDPAIERALTAQLDAAAEARGLRL